MLKNNYVYVSYEEVTNVIHDDFGDDGPYTGSYQHETTSTITGVSLTVPDSHYYEYLPVEGLPDKTIPTGDVFVLAVRYSTGDTFGSESGRLHIPGVYHKYEDALTVGKKIREGSFKGYAPWEGFFESLEDILIESFSIS